MSSTDKRIVELEFDNKSFEAGVKQTLETLDSLDKNLDQIDGKSLQGLQDSINDVSFRGMEEGIESLNDRFSNMGVFVKRIMENIADDVYNAGKKIISSSIGQIMSGGARRSANIRQAKFMWEGLWQGTENLEENIKSIDQSVSDAVNNTAYGYDEAALAAASLASSGVELGDQMTTTLQTISGLAAMTGSDFSNMANIFVKVAGNGKLMSRELQQIRGINIAQEIAKSLGTTEEIVRTELIPKGQINLDTLVKATHKFWDQAERANEIYTGALKNLQAALSRIGQPLYDAYYEYAKDVLNAIRPLLNILKSKAFEKTYISIDRNLRKYSEKIVNALNIFKDKDKKELKDEYIETFANINRILQEAFATIMRFVDSLVNIITSIGKAFKEVFNEDISSYILKFVHTIHQFFIDLKHAKGLYATIHDISLSVFKTIKFILSILKSLYNFLSPIFKDFILPLAGNVLRTIFDIIAKIVQKVSGLTNFLDKFMGLDFGGNKIFSGLKSVHEKIDNFFYWLRGNIDWLFNNMDNLPQLLNNLSGKIREFADSKLEKAANFLGKFGINIGKIKTEVSDNTFLTKLKTFFDSIKDFIKSINIKDIFSKALERLKNFKDGIKEVFTFLKPLFSDFIGMLNNFAETITKMITEPLSGESGKNLLSGGILATLVMVIGKIRDIIKTTSFSDLRGGLLNLMTRFGYTLQSYQRTLDAEALMTLAKAIGILAGSILVLSLLDTEKVVQITGVIMALGAGLAFFLRTFTNTKATTVASTLQGLTQSVGSFLKTIGLAIARAIKLDSIMLAMDMFAFAILEVAGALVIVSSIPWDKMKTGIAGLSICFAMLSAAFIGVWQLSNSLNGGEVGKLAGVAAALAITSKSISTAMIAMGVAISIFAAVYNNSSSGFFAAVLAISGIVVVLANAMIMIQKSFNEETAFRIMTFAATMVVLASSLSVLAIGVAALAGAFAIAGTLSAKGMIQGITILVTSLGTLVIAAKYVKGQMASILALGVAVALISSSMLQLTAALIALELVKPESILKFAGIMLTFAVTMIGVAQVFKIVVTTLNSYEGSLLTFSKAILMFGGGIALFGFGVLTLTASIALLAASAPLIKIAAKAFAEGIFAFLEAMSEGSIRLGAAIENIITTAIASLINSVSNVWVPLIDTIGGMAIKALDLLRKYIPPLVSKIADFIVITLGELTKKIPQIVDAVFGFLDTLFSEVSKHLGEFSFRSFTMIALTLAELTGVIYLFDSMKKHLPGALKTVGVMALVLGMVVAAFAIMDALDVEHIYATALGLSSVLVALSASMFIMSKIPIAGAVKGALGISAAFGIIVGAATAIVAGLGLLDKIKGFRTVVESGKDILILLGEAIGGFLGAIASGIMAGVSVGIAALGAGLGQFWNNAAPFFDGISNLDPNAVEAAKNLASVILILGAAELVDVIADFLGASTDFEGLRNNLVNFAGAIVDFSAVIDPLSEESLKKTSLAAKASKNLALFASYVPKTGGFLQDLIGSADISGFSDSMVSYGKALVKFSKKARELTEDDVKAIKIATKAGNGFAEFANSIPASGGVWQYLAGSKDLGVFGKQLVVYADNVVKFAETARLLPTAADGAAKNMVTIGQYFRDLLDTLPKTTASAWSVLAGRASLDALGKEVAKYGESMVLFYEHVKSLPTNAIVSANIAAKMGSYMSELAKSIPRSSASVWGLLAGGQDIGQFGSQLSLFGLGMSTFYDNTKDIPTGAVTVAETVRDMGLPLIDLANAISDMGKGSDDGLANFGSKLLGFDINGTQFSSMLTALATGIIDFSDKMKDADLSDAAGKMDDVKKIIDVLKTVDERVAESGDNLKKAFDSLIEVSTEGFVQDFAVISNEQITTALNQLFNSITDAIQQYKISIPKQMQILLDGMLEGINSKLATVSTDTKKVFGGLKGYLETLKPVFYSAGTGVIENYVKGIQDKGPILKTTLDQIVSATKLSLEDIHTGMWSLGVGAINGFIQGAKSKSNEVDQSFWLIGRLALKAARKALDSNSPSKEFAKIGADSDVGLAGGLIRYSYLVEDASTKVAKVALDSVGNSIATISSMLDEGIDINPVITPVLDSSLLQNGISAINGMFPNTSLGLSRSIGYRGQYINSNTYNDANVIKSISDLTDRIDTLGDKMGRMQLVLNGKRLVGGIASDMNDAFGGMETLTRRGVM